MGITCKMNADQFCRQFSYLFFQEGQKKIQRISLKKKKSMRILYKMNSDQIYREFFYKISLGGPINY